MIIVGWIKTSLIDWPGKISSVFFVSGCNFRCPFCHNSHLVEPKKIKKLKSYSEKIIFEDLKKRQQFIDGVVISGGEPTLQPDLPKFLKKVKELGLGTMIETNGSKPKVISRLISSNLVNFIALDFKAPLDTRYSQTVGVSNFNSQIWALSLRKILLARIPFELRTTIVPRFHSKKILVKMAKQLRQIAKLSEYSIANLNWCFQQFHPENCLNSEFEKIKPFSNFQIEKFLKVVQKVIPQTKIRY